MNPRLPPGLELTPPKPSTAGEVANLLNGQRADGGEIMGKQKQASTEGIGTVFAMDESRMPTRSELENVLAGRKVDGTALPAEAARKNIRRFQAVLGARQEVLNSGAA